MIFDDFEGDLLEAESKKSFPVVLNGICKRCEKNIDRSEVEPKIRDKLARGKAVAGESLCIDCLFLTALS
ncbi:MAG: hypothetical protein COV02_01900 [Candidatus Terrybacteria bacterium CG10_big_fil_rev_8_21_14_0_10_41_10]|uniref:Uncharacterized protein n=1 Tax=Candidatus Terrybacteria bacterium CG10_big_fil_rev_8_21_14_0_10_41_10 TaxID=1975026 RepID=A0A2M8LAD9_9BACT|nr:MAG: hypothetical protein COV02_01900 [Candidatus Terrybacteria bacterium CG10_big_fil_rev_8_21_14_0_10_41_10]